MSETRSTTQAELLREVADAMEGALLLLADCRDALAEHKGTLGRLEARPTYDDKTLARRISEAWAGEMLPLPDPPKPTMPWGWMTLILALAFLVGMVAQQGVAIYNQKPSSLIQQPAPKKVK